MCFTALQCSNTTDVSLRPYTTVLKVAHSLRWRGWFTRNQSAQTDGWNAVKTTKDDFISLPPTLLIWISEKKQTHRLFAKKKKKLTSHSQNLEPLHHNIFENIVGLSRERLVLCLQGQSDERHVICKNSTQCCSGGHEAPTSDTGGFRIRHGDSSRTENPD